MKSSLFRNRDDRKLSLKHLHRIRTTDAVYGGRLRRGSSALLNQELIADLNVLRTQKQLQIDTNRTHCSIIHSLNTQSRSTQNNPRTIAFFGVLERPVSGAARVLVRCTAWDLCNGSRIDYGQPHDRCATRHVLRVLWARLTAHPRSRIRRGCARRQAQAHSRASRCVRARRRRSAALRSTCMIWHRMGHEASLGA